MTPRSIRPEVFCKKGVFRNFAKFTGKHLCQSFFLNKEISKNTFSYRAPPVAASLTPTKFEELLRMVAPSLTKESRFRDQTVQKNGCVSHLGI